MALTISLDALMNIAVDFLNGNDAKMYPSVQKNGGATKDLGVLTTHHGAGKKKKWWL